MSRNQSQAAAAVRAQVRADLAYALARKADTTATAAAAGGGGTAIGFVENEVPGGACDGVRTVFALARVPVAASLKVHIAGVRTTDFTFAGTVLTMNVAPLATDSLLVDYRYTP